MSLEIEETYLGFQIHVGQIKMITTDNEINYVFPVKLTYKGSTSYQNLTITDRQGVISAFVTTFSPSVKWIKEYKKGRRIKFEGKITFTPISLIDNEPQKSLSSYSPTRLMQNTRISYVNVCKDYRIWESIDFPCVGSPRHLPGDVSCYLIGTSGEAYSVYMLTTERICVEDQGGGNDGGGGTTNDPPPGYDPNCENPQNFQSSIREVGFSRIAAIPPPGCDEFDEEPAIPLIDNDVEIQCVANAVNILLDHNNTSNGIAKVIKEFMQNPDLNLRVITGQTIRDVPAELDFIRPNSTSITGVITLDEDFITNFSNEAIVSKMIHEILHAHLEVKGIIGQPLQHSEMGEKYIVPFAQLMKDIFPNMQEEDAVYLAYSGLGYYVKDKPANEQDFTHVINNRTVTINRGLIGSVDYNYNKANLGTAACTP